MFNLYYIYLISKCLFQSTFFMIIRKLELVVVISYKFLLQVLSFFKKNSITRFDLLMDIIAIDKPYSKNRFVVLYRLTSEKFNYNILVNVLLMQNTAISTSLKLYSSAGWLEREVWDFFGIYFYNHNDLRRILTDYGFVGFPLRKDFPLSGYMEVSYIDEKKRVVLEPLDVTQEFRFFNFRSSWE